MKVSDIMDRQVDFVTTDTSVRQVARIIFGRGINGVPVCAEGRKVVGFITERDILTRFFPTMQEYITDPVHEADFEEMEQKSSEIMALTADTIMTKDLTTVSEDTPILRAQSLMFVRKVGRLPVVDDNGKLIGVITNGDVFRAVVGGRLPFEGEEEFFDWQARYYDVYVDWQKRLEAEIPDIKTLLQKTNAKKVLDVAASSGEHAIALAKNGVEVWGIETSGLIYRIAERKRKELPEALRRKVNFLRGDYEKVVKVLPGDFDAAVFLGNALSHVIYTDKHILEEVTKVLNPDKSVMIFQMLNFEKLFNSKGGLREFSIRKSHFGYEHEHAFLAFYTKGKAKEVLMHFAVFDHSTTRWIFRGLRTTTIAHIGKKEIASMLKKLGFSKVSFYGGSFYGPLFSHPFKPLESDWMNVVAMR